MPPNIQAFLKSDRLPTLPAVALKVLELTRQPEPNIAELAQTIRADQAISSRILQAANSALFGLRGRVSSIEAAIPHLGLTPLKSLVLGFALTGTKPEQQIATRAIESLWRSSLTQAVFAERLAIVTGEADPATCFLAGLLQDVGVLSFLHVDPENYLANVWSQSRFPNVISAELRTYQFSHIDIAIELCWQWGLEDNFADAIAGHHSQTVGRQQTALELALKAANLCAQFVVNSDRPDAMTMLAKFLKRHYRWRADKVEAEVCESLIQVHEMAALFSCDIGSMPPEQLQHRAKTQLENLRLQDEQVRVPFAKKMLSAKRQDA